MAAQRAALAAEARSWLGTRYARNGQKKGAGCDCATLLLCSLKACGLVPADETLGGVFGNDWFANTSDEQYMYRLLRHAPKICEMVAYRTSQIETGNILLLKAAGSKLYNHAGIVVAYPRIVHAIAPAVEEIDVTRHPMWIDNVVAVFDPFAKQHC